MPQRISSDRVLLSTAEASVISGVGVEHIQRLLRTGRLEGIKPGHDWFVYEDSLRTYLAQPRKPGPKGSRKKLEDIAGNASSDSSGQVDKTQ